MPARQKYREQQPEIPRDATAKYKARVPPIPTTPTRMQHPPREERWKCNSVLDDNSVHHPPSAEGTTNPYSIESVPSLAYKPSGEQSILYHPPINHDALEAEKEVDRYSAAMDISFPSPTTASPNRQWKFTLSRSLDSAVLSSTTTETGLDKVTSSRTSITNDNTDEEDTYSARQGKRRIAPMALSSESYKENLLGDDLQAVAEDDYFDVKQPFGYFAIGITAVQLLVLTLQLALCGTAPLDVNPMIGPYPDAFSEWGGKNAYLIVEGHELWRFVSPAFLHVGILHLLCNAYVQLETCAFFEREWGSKRWVTLYILSEIGCVVVSCVLNPDTLAVGSSGAVMGLFGAKCAQLVTNSVFSLVGTYNPKIRLEQLSGIMCSLSIIAVLSFVTYIDWSGHVGGFATGFCAGIVAFARPIRSSAEKFVWIMIGLALLGTGGFFAFQALFTTTSPDEDLADPCEYFRNLYAEGYKCECVWG